MKIGFDAKRIFHNTTGLGNYGRGLIKGLSRYYPENQYFLYNPKKGKKKLFKLEYNTFEIYPRKILWKTFSSLWRQKGLIKQLKEDNIQIFHGLSGELPRGIHKTKILSVVTIHDLIFIRYPKLYSFIDRKIYYNKFKYAIDKSNLIIAISNQTKEDIIEYFNTDPEKIIVVYQGCDDYFKQNYSQSELKQTRLKFNLPNNFILYVGAITKRKNLLTIVKSIRKLDCNLVIIGRDNRKYADKVKKYIENSELEDRTTFLKDIQIEELAMIYQLADVFVYPSIFEGFGIPIIESLFSKTAVITSSDGCFSEAGGESTIYVDPLNSDEIEKQIKFLINNPNEKNYIEERGFEYVQKFNDKAISSELIKVYNKLLLHHQL